MKTMVEGVREVVEFLGRSGECFQFRDVRETLRISAKDRSQAGSAYEAFRKLIDGGSIEQEPSQDGRKRYRSYRLVAAGRGKRGQTEENGDSPVDVLVQLPNGQGLTFWATKWEVRNGHLSLVGEQEGRTLATFAPGSWTSCVGDQPLEWAMGIK